MIGKILLLIITTILLVVISHFNFETFDHIRVYNFITESFIAMVAALFFIKSHELKGKPYYIFISLGFYLTFVALVTDSLDQFYFHTELYTAVMEKTLRVVGYALVFLGVSQWLNEYFELNETLKKQIEKDVLTGLYNRQGIQNQLHQFHEMVQTSNIECSIAIIDIDNFKTVNDNFGHIVGDQVLKRIGTKLSELSRSNIKVGRWGGEEFTVVMSAMSLQDSVKFCQQICQDIEEMDLYEFLGDQNITFSIGVTKIHSNDSIGDFLSRADKALYQSKEKGKNQVSTID